MLLSLSRRKRERAGGSFASADGARDDGVPLGMAADAGDEDEGGHGKADEGGLGERVGSAAIANIVSRKRNEEMRYFLSRSVADGGDGGERVHLPESLCNTLELARVLLRDPKCRISCFRSVYASGAGKGKDHEPFETCLTESQSHPNAAHTCFAFCMALKRDVFGCLFPEEFPEDETVEVSVHPIDLSSELADATVSSTDGFGRLGAGSIPVRLPKALLDSLPSEKPAVVEFGEDGVPTQILVFDK